MHGILRIGGSPWTRPSTGRPETWCRRDPRSRRRASHSTRSPYGTGRPGSKHSVHTLTWRPRGSGPAGSQLRIAPEAPSRFDRERVSDDGSSDVLWLGARSVAFGRRLRGRWRRTDLDELELSNKRSSFVVPHRSGLAPEGDGPDRSRSRCRDTGDPRAGRLPAGADLVATKGSALAVKPAVAELGRDGSAEVPAGRASGGGPVADPAHRRLGLRCRAVRTSPHRHRCDGSCERPRCRMRAETALAFVARDDPIAGNARDA